MLVLRKRRLLVRYREDASRIHELASSDLLVVDQRLTDREVDREIALARAG